MTPLLVIIGTVIALRVIAGMMTSEEPAPAPAALPPPPRRRPPRRAAPRVPAPAAVAEPDDEGPAVHLVHAAKPLAAPRRAAPFALRGRADARRAVILREVLGPPLSLRR